MDLQAVFDARYSVRQFADKAVEPEKVQSILEAGRLAPTARNYQPQKILVLQQPEGLETLGKTARLYNAPLALLVCADTSQSWKRPFDGMDSGQIDATIVTTYMMLEATRLGLGSVWICRFDPAVVKEDFNLPDHIVPVNILAVGYKADGAEPAEFHFSRKPLSETVAYEKHNW
ncbi:MAG: nitroreductase [Firmicutes bacterium]|nr:nitroreductase [Bacillota bacterium]